MEEESKILSRYTFKIESTHVSGHSPINLQLGDKDQSPTSTNNTVRWKPHKKDAYLLTLARRESEDRKTIAELNSTLAAATTEANMTTKSKKVKTPGTIHNAIRNGRKLGQL
jgi:hypothetical protein